jgi:hypothetical protein
MTDEKIRLKLVTYSTFPLTMSSLPPPRHHQTKTRPTPSRRDLGITFQSRLLLLPTTYNPSSSTAERVIGENDISRPADRAGRSLQSRPFAHPLTQKLNRSKQSPSQNSELNPKYENPCRHHSTRPPHTRVLHCKT